MRRMAGRAWIGALAAAGLVTGCSDGGSGSDANASPTYGELSDQAGALEDRTENLPLTDPSVLPTSGSASYDGVIGLVSDGAGGAPEDFAGELTLNVDFRRDDLSGQATNFVTAGEERLDGTLAITGGDIARGTDPELEPTYAFDMGGTLSDTDGDDYRVDATGVGAFLGEDAEATFGFVGGEMISKNGTASLGGAYVAD